MELNFSLAISSLNLEGAAFNLGLGSGRACVEERVVGGRMAGVGRRRRLGEFSVQSVGAAQAVSLAIGHNHGRVATPTPV